MKSHIQLILLTTPIIFLITTMIFILRHSVPFFQLEVNVKFPNSQILLLTNSSPNECSQVDSEQVSENQIVSKYITHKVFRRIFDAIILSRSDIRTTV